jgi:hypothetical protein
MWRRPLGIWPPTFRDDVVVAYRRVKMSKMNSSWKFWPFKMKVPVEFDSQRWDHSVVLKRRTPLTQ